MPKQRLWERLKQIVLVDTILQLGFLAVIFLLAALLLLLEAC